MTVKTRRTRPDGKRMLSGLHRTPEHDRLAERLLEVAGRKLSADEILEQTVSWIYGNMPDDSRRHEGTGQAVAARAARDGVIVQELVKLAGLLPGSPMLPERIRSRREEYVEKLQAGDRRDLTS